MVSGVFRDLAARAERDIRKALAERLAGADWAPHDLIVMLATDEIEIARPLIASSPVLTEEDLLGLLRQMAIEHQIEVARRPGIGPPVVSLILNQGQPAVLSALADNDTADLTAQALSRLVEASRQVAALRSPLVRHPRLTPDLAKRLYAFVGESLREAIVDRFHIDAGALDQALEQAVSIAQARHTGVTFVQEPERRQMERQLVAKLNDAGQLKPGYLIRALREQRLSLFIASLAELSGLDVDALERAIETDRAELLALACTAAGVDRSVFSTIVALVRQLSGGHPAGGSGTGRRALQAFSIHEPLVAAAAFRKSQGAPQTAAI
jgi:uncharacterized protein (DUF2336 family)